MCGFVITQGDLKPNHTFVQRRGPDGMNTVTIEGFTITHHLLHITGEKRPQPFYREGMACVFNGEIYNYKSFADYASDGECILDLYAKHGPDFAKLLDGEFAIVILDFVIREIVIALDTFNTKPCWLNLDGGIGVASYQSACGGSKLKGNAVYRISMDSLGVRTAQLHDFDLEQKKDTYDDWIKAFKGSIAKRLANTICGVFLGLSSGYDSGAIACELDNQKARYKAYTIIGNENVQIIEARHALLQSGQIRYVSQKDYDAAFKRIATIVEPFKYRDKMNKYKLHEDKAAVGLALVCEMANTDNQRVYLSGHGADEIISDYGFNGKHMKSHSEFGGKFPNKLEGFFPWHSFYDGTMIKYGAKEEYVAGAYGIETRYPFLDVALVQEFLWLSPDLKNKQYKAPLCNYLELWNYPFEKGAKRGFRAKDNLI